VVYAPILLGAVLKAAGNVSPATVPAKARYISSLIFEVRVRIAQIVLKNASIRSSEALDAFRMAEAA
jgi:2-hydroxychromene-2-carboxylate isomerase